MALRTFTSPDGIEWNVWNVVPTLSHNDRKLALGDGMTTGWLCFEGNGVKRRIVPTPDGWEAWSDAQLAEALGSAQSVMPRQPREPRP